MASACAECRSCPPGARRSTGWLERKRDHARRTIQLRYAPTRSKQGRGCLMLSQLVRVTGTDERHGFKSRLPDYFFPEVVDNDRL